MAFEIKKIDPIDLQPRKAVGVSLPFSGKAVFNQTFETKQGPLFSQFVLPLFYSF